jgi:hypothetical protein
VQREMGGDEEVLEHDTIHSIQGGLGTGDRNKTSAISVDSKDMDLFCYPTSMDSTHSISTPLLAQCKNDKLHELMSLFIS